MRNTRLGPGPLPGRHLLSYLGDGMMDLFLGLLLIDASVALAGGSATSSGLGFLMIYLLLLAAKEWVTAPRLAAEELAQTSRRRSERPPWRRWRLPAVLLACAAVLAVWWIRPPSPLPWGLIPAGAAWLLVALLGLAAVAFAGYRLAAPRFIVYAAATATALVAGAVLGAGWMPILIAAVGAGIAAVGAAMLGQFLRQHPRIGEGGGRPEAGRP